MNLFVKTSENSGTQGLYTTVPQAPQYRLVANPIKARLNTNLFIQLTTTGDENGNYEISPIVKIENAGND